MRIHILCCYADSLIRITSTNLWHFSMTQKVLQKYYKSQMFVSVIVWEMLVFAIGWGETMKRFFQNFFSVRLEFAPFPKFWYVQKFFSFAWGWQPQPLDPRSVISANYPVCSVMLTIFTGVILDGLQLRSFRNKVKKILSTPIQNVLIRELFIGLQMFEAFSKID